MGSAAYCEEFMQILIQTVHFLVRVDQSPYLRPPNYAAMQTLLMREMERSLDSYLAVGFGDRLQQWAEEASSRDAEQMVRWNEYVQSVYDTNPCLRGLGVDFHRIDQIKLFDPERRSCFDPLRMSNQANCERWVGRNGGKFFRRYEKNPYYPMMYCHNGEKVLGFDFLGSHVDPDKNPDPEDSQPQYPAMYDEYGTFETNYAQTMPVLIFAPTIRRLKSKHIDFTLICKGFKEFNRNMEPPMIPMLQPDTEGEMDLGLDPAAGLDPDAVEEPSEPGFVDMEGNEYGGDDPTVPTPLSAAELRATAGMKVEWKQSDQTQQQIWYLTARNLDDYITALIDSKAFSAAARKAKYNPDVTVRRICAWMLLKAHVVMLCWDTMLDEAKNPVCHRIYICNNRPQDTYVYRDEFRGGRCNDDILSSFHAGLSFRGYIGKDSVPVEVYNDTAFRATFRRNFLIDELYGADINCNAYVTLCALYLSMVADVVKVFEDGSRRQRFATRDTKRLFRFEVKCFDLHLRNFLATEINERGNAVWISSKMAQEAVGMHDIFLLSANPGESKPRVYAYTGAAGGFVCTTPQARRRTMCSK